MIALKPGARTYATDLWRTRRGFVAPADPEAARDALFDCDRKGCAPRPGTLPALGAWWSTRPPPEGRLAALCQASVIVVLRTEVAPPADCAGRIVLGPPDVAAGGAAEIFTTSKGFRLSWAEPIRGRRPWTGISDSDE